MEVANEQSKLVGRDVEVKKLRDTLRNAGEGRSVLFIAGEQGSGKQALLDEVERLVRQDAASTNTFFAKGVCRGEHDAENPYEPFAEMLVDLVVEDRGTKRWNAILDAVKEVAPDWLGMVPVAGDSDIGSGCASSLTVAGPRLSRSTMTLRLGSASA